MRKFVIIAPARSGSRMLTERIMSHPDVLMQSELLNPALLHRLSRRQKIWLKLCEKFGVTRARANLQFNGHNFLPVVENLVWGPNHKEFEAGGFKIILGQWLSLSANQQKLFLSRYEPRVIWLKRRDIIAHFVSTAQAERSGYRHRVKGQAPVELPPVRVTIEDLKAFHRNNFAQQSLLRSQFSSFECIETSYEDLVANPEFENRRLLEFLGVRPVPLTEVLAKNSSADLSKRIADYEAFALSLRGSVYERLLPSDRIEGV